MNPKTKNIVAWVLSGLLCLMFLFAASGKLTGQMETQFKNWGYDSVMFMYLIGALEGLGAIGLLIPKLRKWSALGLIGIMIGAALTHVVNNEYERILMNILLIAAAYGTIFLRKDE